MDEQITTWAATTDFLLTDPIPLTKPMPTSVDLQLLTDYPNLDMNLFFQDRVPF